MRSMSQVHPISDLYSHTIEAHVEFEKEKKGIIQFRVNEKKKIRGSLMAQKIGSELKCERPSSLKRKKTNVVTSF